MIERMATARITEAELARDVHAVLAKVQEGVEVIVERDHRPVAVIKTPARSGPQKWRVHRTGEGARSEARLCAGARSGFRQGRASGDGCPPRAVESAGMGLVLDAGVLIAAERDARPVSELLVVLEHEHGETDLVLSSITVIELEHGLHRAQTAEQARKRANTWILFSQRSR